MIQELLTYIEQAQSAFVIGDNLRLWADDSVGDRCVVLQDIGGSPEFLPKDVDTHLVALTSRAAAIIDARDDAYVIYNLLHGSAGIDLPEIVTGTLYRVNTITARNSPQFVGQDDKGRFLWTITFIVRLQLL